jgi:peptidase M1-like protein
VKRLLLLAAAAALWAPASASAQTWDQAVNAGSIYSTDGKPLSQRVVHYTIEARYNDKAHTLDATETLVYRNLTGKPLDTFPFHLYLNSFQPQSTWMREGHRDFPGLDWEEKYRGADNIQQLTVDGMGDLTGKLQFVSPDDGNPDDRSVVEVKLPKPVPPGASVTFRIKFYDVLPEVVARTGYMHDFVMGAQWFPKVGVWWHGAWNCHQFHVSTEFFSDFGVYDVRLTLPQGYVTGASGIEVGSKDNPDGTRTVTWHGEDIHDFAWSASRRFVVAEDTFPGSAGPVKMRALVLRAHAAQVQRYLTALRQAMDHFDRWYGPYPYKQITLVDPDPDSRAGGMEYPTLFTADTAWWMPRGLLLPELATVHEYGHQYWYGMVATNEMEEAWLDEGINQYSETSIMDDLYGPERSALDLFGATAGDTELFAHLFYSRSADTDPVTRKAYEFMSMGSYGNVTYGKTASLLHTLESVIGKETLRRALHTYFLRYRFTHPTGEDFLKTIEEVSGRRDLRPYFDQAVYGTQVLDYEVLKISSDPVTWWKPESGSGATYRNEVLVHRKGDFIFPVTVAVRFDDGEVVRESWEGKDRWIRYTYEKKAKVVSAEVDPDHAVYLDRDLFNNSRTAKPDVTAARKLHNYWLFCNQWLAQIVSWLI